MKGIKYFMIKAIIIGVAVVLFLILILTSYVKAPPNMAYVISGLKKHPKVLIGRAGIKWPILERLDKLLLGQITIDIKTEGYIPTRDFINIQVDAVAKVKVGNTEEMMALAMKNFLNKNSDAIIEDLQDSLQGNMREIIGTLDLRSICNDRNEFGNMVQESATKDMAKLGIEIISCNIQNVNDETDLIVNMGADNTAKIRKDASIAKAEAERDVAIKQAEADKAANDAKVASELEIAQKQNELEIKKAELKKVADVKKAEADAAYEIQQQEQRKSIEIASSNADIAKQEREAEKKKQEVLVKEQALAAEVKKTAEAEKFRRQQEAEAELFERQKNADAQKAEAEAKKYALEQEAEGIKAKGQAEAEAIKAKALAEAEGLQKKAEAMQKYGEAAILEMYFKSLPEAIKNAAEPLGNVESITMYGNGNNEQMISSIMNTVTQVNDGIKGSTGLDMKSVLAGVLGTKALSSVASDNNEDVDADDQKKEEKTSKENAKYTEVVETVKKEKTEE